MHFSHADAIWAEFPGLVPGVVHASGIRADADVRSQVGVFTDRARARLAGSSEGELPEIQAWRRAFSTMGLKPTQYRCAAESLLRRFRKEGALPALHPLVDLCNAVSLAYAVPIAVLDLAQVDGWIEVRHATGAERYQDFSGAIECPDPNEVVFVDAAGHAHARRWCHRQSGLSAVGPRTSEVLIVAEAMHAGAPPDLRQLIAELTAMLKDIWSIDTHAKLLRRDDPVFEA